MKTQNILIYAMLTVFSSLTYAGSATVSPDQYPWQNVSNNAKIEYGKGNWVVFTNNSIHQPLYARVEYQAQVDFACWKIEPGSAKFYPQNSSKIIIGVALFLEEHLCTDKYTNVPSESIHWVSTYQQTTYGYGFAYTGTDVHYDSKYPLGKATHVIIPSCTSQTIPNQYNKFTGFSTEQPGDVTYYCQYP